jgi:hypothetical protein
MNADVAAYLESVTAPTRRRDAATLLELMPGVGCVYIKDLHAVDLEVLERILARSYATVTADTFGGPAGDD